MERDVTPNAVAWPKMPDTTPWYAIQVRPRYERQVVDAIHRKGVNTLFPTYSVKRKWADREKQLEFPLFDGYVFCQTPVNERLPILVTPGVVKFVGIGKTPVEIEPAEIHALHKVVEAGSKAQPWPFLREGERIRIENGPLCNMEGILVRGEEDRVVISVSLLQRSISVQMDRSWIAPIRPWLRGPFESRRIA